MKNKTLHQIKSSGFKVPDGYLESVDDLFLNTLKDRHPLEGYQNSGFKVPDQYFEHFDEKIIKAISSEKEVKVIPLMSWKKVVYVTGIAASIILMVSLFNNYNSTPTFGDLETASIQDYIVDEDFTNEDIASLLSDDLTLDNFMDSNLINSKLEDYILNNTSVEDYLIE
jgi:low affinity Fe/Cu permease